MPTGAGEVMVTSCPDISKAAREQSSRPNSFPSGQYRRANRSLRLLKVEKQLQIGHISRLIGSGMEGGDDERRLEEVGDRGIHSDSVTHLPSSSDLLFPTA